MLQSQPPSRWYPEEGTLSFWIRKKIYDNEKNSVKYLTGKILTLIDASIQDPEQRKAFKDLARTIISDVLYHQSFDWTVEYIAEKVQDKEPPGLDCPVLNPPIKYIYTRQSK